MGDTASKDTTEHALSIVGGVVGDRPKISNDEDDGEYAVMDDEQRPFRTNLASHFAAIAEIRVVE